MKIPLGNPATRRKRLMRAVGLLALDSSLYVAVGLLFRYWLPWFFIPVFLASALAVFYTLP